jgi:hypothetical protein
MSAALIRCLRHNAAVVLRHNMKIQEFSFVSFV